MSTTQAGLFEGYGGLTMAVADVLGADLAWYSEVDPAASRLLAHHHPDIPNLGDITAIDWATAPRVDVVTGGFPCQDVSLAGKRRGIRPDSRSGLWTHMAYAIDQLRPSLVVIENVRGLLSADAACDLEPCPWCLGDDEGRPLRALGAVLGDLADLGYDARWCGLRAADVGAPHGRFRVFVTARPAPDADGGAVRQQPVAEPRRGGASVAGRAVRDASLLGRDAAPAAGGRDEPARAPGRSGVAPADPDGAGRGTRSGLPRPGGPSVVGDGAPAAPDPGGDGRARHPQRDLGSIEPGQHAPLGDDVAGRVLDLDWGDYTPAIRRWEHTLGRVAPSPTSTGKRGGQQLSARFVEWLMGLPAGYVTDVPGLTRNEQLARLGNGVVPQQAVAALRHLLRPDLEPSP